MKDTKSFTEVSVNDMRNAVYILVRQNVDGQIISKREIGCKKAGELKQTKLVVTTGKPFVLKYHKTTENLNIFFSCGRWSDSGLPQH